MNLRLTRMLQINKRKFTLIEILITIAIVVILLSLLISVIIHARRITKMANETNNLKQIYQAFINYADKNNGYFPYIESISTGDNMSKTIWLLLPYLGYSTKVISPNIEVMDGVSIYSDILSSPSSTPTPGLSYSPIYENPTGDLYILNLNETGIPDIPIVATPKNKYPDKILHLTFGGSVK
jgi:type II secretory pathway pseudopilin PulG